MKYVENYNIFAEKEYRWLLININEKQRYTIYKHNYIFIGIRVIKISTNMIIQKIAKYDILFNRLIIKFNNMLNGGRLW